MKRAVKFIILLTTILTACSNNSNETISTKSKKQETALGEEPETDYRMFIDKNFIGQKKTIKTEYGAKEITYLGDIENFIGQSKYSVLTIFETVQAAITIHGHSSVIYIDTKSGVTKQFELGMPDELPFKLEKNTLFFHYIDSKTNSEKTFINSVGTETPKLLCVSPDNCY